MYGSPTVTYLNISLTGLQVSFLASYHFANKKKNSQNHIDSKSEVTNFQIPSHTSYSLKRQKVMKQLLCGRREDPDPQVWETANKCTVNLPDQSVALGYLPLTSSLSKSQLHSKIKVFSSWSCANLTHWQEELTFCTCTVISEVSQ